MFKKLKKKGFRLSKWSPLTTLGIAALIGGISAGASESNNVVMTVVSDATWTVSDSVPTPFFDCPTTINSEGPEWTQLNFDDSSWRNSFEGYQNKTAENVCWANTEGTDIPLNVPRIWDWPNDTPPNGSTGANEVYFRKTFSIDSEIVSAGLRIHVDDHFQFYINGKLVAQGSGIPEVPIITEPPMDVSSYLHQGQNIIAMRALDGHDPCQATNRGCESAAVKLEITKKPPARPQCRGREATLIGTAHGDILWGTPGDDVILGRGGNDVIYGLGGNDIICGGKGADTLYGNKGNDVLYGGKGHDWIYGGRGNDRLFGGKAADSLFGGPGRDRCNGGRAHDYARGCEIKIKIP